MHILVCAHTTHAHPHIGYKDHTYTYLYTQYVYTLAYATYLHRITQTPHAPPGTTTHIYIVLLNHL